MAAERLTLATENVNPTARETIANFHRLVVDEVASAVARDKVVVVGMAQNPFVKKTRKSLEEAGVRFTYLEYGSYLSGWKQRLAIKMWSGFPTFPMVFVGGKLVGGNAELDSLKAEGKLAELR
ncbi:MAG TPA: glutaredoxin domain-containing protein [Polyangiaceae bacterium]|nr:glutaredoxin domain-containing protein [Polyangiaceae bacterium]